MCTPAATRGAKVTRAATGCTVPPALWSQALPCYSRAPRRRRFFWSARRRTVTARCSRSGSRPRTAATSWEDASSSARSSMRSSKVSRLGLTGARRFVEGDGDGAGRYAEFLVFSSSFSQQTAVGKAVARRPRGVRLRRAVQYVPCPLPGRRRSGGESSRTDSVPGSGRGSLAIATLARILFHGAPAGLTSARRRDRLHQGDH